MNELLEKIIVNSKNTDLDSTSTRFSQEETNTIFHDFYTNRKKYESCLFLSQSSLPQHSSNILKKILNTVNTVNNKYFNLATNKKSPNTTTSPNTSGSTSSSGLKSGLVFTPYISPSPIITFSTTTIPSRHSYNNKYYAHSFRLYFINDKDVFKGAYVHSTNGIEILIDKSDYLQWVLKYKLSKI